MEQILSGKEVEVINLFKQHIDKSTEKDFDSVFNWYVRIKLKNGSRIRISMLDPNPLATVEISNQKFQVSSRVYKEIEEYFQRHLIKINKV